ncbi:MAG: B12-binding domain-containing radical SAM protein [Myxococcaceae bacterium]|nr:B12-binding domain-containing radical SAM protein [Myxococcaceae bacterium]
MDIALCTLNAKFIHASLGLRWLYANLGELKGRTRLLELDINQQPRDMVEAVMATKPRIVGFGVYIWNVEPTLAVIRMLKALDPTLRVVLGGPEVSHETNGQPIVEAADHVICGEADVAFAELCTKLLAGERPPKVLKPPLPDLGALVLPWDEYGDQDLKQRLLYVEASRGCPYRCEFCLSSLDEKVRSLPLEPFLAAMQRLLDRGARHFKFVDRTFNLDLKQSRRILEFFLERLRPDLFLHFELVPDRLPEPLREVIAKFPPGVLQFEVGIQTFNPEVEKLISRRQDHARLEDNLRWLTRESHVHVHADLIVGLPGEDLQSFARGFDALVKLAPQEIQVGVLKRLKGTPITRHGGMVYSPVAPYEVLKTPWLTFDEVNVLRRFARTWDLFANSGDFKLTFERLMSAAASPFELVMQLNARIVGPQTGIALTRRFRLMFSFLVEVLGWSREEAADQLLADYTRLGKSDRAAWLDSLPDAQLAQSALSARQERHRAAG